MPSPFPGMNPYLEQDDAWHGFHKCLIPYISEVIVPQVRPRYIVKLGEHVYIHELLTAIDVERLSFVEIRDRHSRELITIIEVLSPSNKRIGPDREKYVAKRRQLLASSVHFVEIDLLRGGPRMPVEDLPDCDYCIMVSRIEKRPHVGIWPIRLRERLPVIPIPLRAPDADARLDLQEALDHLYDAAGYEDYIYTGTPQPPLHPDDAAWARQFLPSIPPPGTAS
jgi:hypothetical protein